jgi:hypothetical protein
MVRADQLEGAPAFNVGRAYAAFAADIDNETRTGSAIILGFRGQPTLPLAANSWSIFQWSLFYGLLRFQPTVLGPQERIHILDQAFAES